MSNAPQLRLNERWQTQVVRLLQAVMIGILLLGIWTVNMGIIMNAGIGLAVTFLPAVLERKLKFTLSAGIVLWISLAMALHAFGTVPLPFFDFVSAYSATWWWDHMTHALSSSLVAAMAYAVVCALDEHTEFIHMPPNFLFVFILLFVLAFGAIWELAEFYITVVSSIVVADTVLTQYGLEDTILDLFYNTVGGVLVAIFGSTALSPITKQITERLDSRSTES